MNKSDLQTTNELLTGLNPQQIEAVTAKPGPTLIIAGPGSGKTRVLTHRIAYLIQQGMPPFKIMAVTFTNKAAKEMRERVERLLSGELRGLTIGTFHSICARILRREAARLNVTHEFVIFDDNDQIAIVKQSLERLNLNDKQYKPQTLLAAISKAKNELIPPEDFTPDSYFNEIAGRVYAEYQKLLRQNNAYDFDDLLCEVVYLFRNQPDVLKKYQTQYDHVLVDEFQDTNTAQYAMVNLLTATKRNLYAVGDPDQCLPSGTLIQTPSGAKTIEKIKVGDQVLASSGRGATMPARVNHIEKRPHQGTLVKVTTRRGLSFSATPNHIVFARLGQKAGLHYVYLMYRKDKGCRVGIASHARSDGVSPELQIGLKVRSNQENADRMWVLKVCASRDEAYYWESFYAFKYGIPTAVFHVRGRRMRTSQESINRLYASIDTVHNAKRLLDELCMDWRFPHFMPQGTFRNLVNLRYFGDGRRSEQSPWNAHRIDLWSNDPQLRWHLKQMGYKPRTGGGKNWRLGFSRLQYDDAQSVAKTLCEQVGDSEIITGAFLIEGKDTPLAPRFSLMPASHLHPSMIIAIEKKGQIIEDEIIQVSEEEYRGSVYDLEIDNVHNYTANRVVVHNSVYRWRGADYRNVKRFENDHPDTKVILLEQNYRSTQNVLDAAMSVINKNHNRTRKQLFTERGTGTKIQIYEAYNEAEEAEYVVSTIATLIKRDGLSASDMAIMYRTNAQSRPLEEVFIRGNLPYRLVGATRFYGRREVKDVIAFLRLVHNPNDTVSLQRIINVPTRGIGAKTVETLFKAAEIAQTSPAEILLDAERCKKVGGRGGIPLSEFGDVLRGWIEAKSELPVAKLIDRILSDVDYNRYINDGTEGGEERWGNVIELRSVAVEYPQITLSEFLEQVALVSDQDTLSDGGGPTLLTLHAAKGLEFGTVFLVGLDEGVLPHERSYDDDESMAEERRLMYVGLTRAKDRLFITRAFRRTTYGGADIMNPSRFLDDLPDHLLTGNFSKGARNSESYKRMTTWESSVKKDASRPVRLKVEDSDSKYKTGQRVKHPLFGDGMIIESKGEGDDELVTVAFEGVGIKRLMANVAELKILKG